MVDVIGVGGGSRERDAVASGVDEDGVKELDVDGEGGIPEGGVAEGVIGAEEDGEGGCGLGGRRRRGGGSAAFRLFAGGEVVELAARVLERGVERVGGGFGSRSRSGGSWRSAAQRSAVGGWGYGSVVCDWSQRGSGTRWGGAGAEGGEEGARADA